MKNSNQNSILMTKYWSYERSIPWSKRRSRYHRERMQHAELRPSESPTTEP